LYFFEDLDKDGVWDSNESLIDPANTNAETYCAGRFGGVRGGGFIKSIGNFGDIKISCGGGSGCSSSVYTLEKLDCFAGWTTIEPDSCWRGQQLAQRAQLGEALTISKLNEWGGTIDSFWLEGWYGDCKGKSVYFSRLMRDWGVCPDGKDCLRSTPAVVGATTVINLLPRDYSQVMRLTVTPPYGWEVSPASYPKVPILNGTYYSGKIIIAAIGIIRAQLPPEVLGLGGAGKAYLGEEATFYTIFRDQDSEVGSNLVQNGSFEGGERGWGFYGGANNNGNSGTIDSVGKFGSKSAKITVVSQAQGVTPYAVWAQVIPNGGGKTVTISGWAKTSGSNTAHICYKNDTDNQVVGCETGVSGSSWQRISKTFTLPAGKQVSVRLQATGVGDAWFDGVLVEEGTTQGIFSDIKWIQFNLENETLTPSSYDANLWPLRLMFSKKHTVDGVTYYDSFYAASNPATVRDWGTPRQANYDSTNKRWYLPSDIPLSNGATLVGGSDKTYFTLSRDGTISASWRVRFESNFPLGSYNQTLHVIDFSNLEDESIADETGFSLLEVDGGPDPDKKWDLHRDGTLEVLRLEDPWFQTQEGDVHAGGTIFSRIPSTCVSPSCSPYFSLKALGGYHGLVSYYGSDPSFGNGSVSEDPKWLAKSQAKRNYYDFFYQLLGSPAADNFNGNLSEITADGVYYSTNDVTLNDDWNFPAGRKAAILVNGKLTLNKKIRVPQGSSLAFIVSGNIEIKGTVGEKVGQAGANEPDIEGVYVSDGEIKTNYDGDNSGNLLVAAGVFIAKQFSLGRNLKRDNSTTPAEKFVYRPDLWLNSYQGLWSSSHVWQELAP